MLYSYTFIEYNYAFVTVMLTRSVLFKASTWCDDGHTAGTPPLEVRKLTKNFVNLLIYRRIRGGVNSVSYTHLDVYKRQHVW